MTLVKRRKKNPCQRKKKVPLRAVAVERRRARTGKGREAERKTGEAKTEIVGAVETEIGGVGIEGEGTEAETETEEGENGEDVAPTVVGVVVAAVEVVADPGDLADLPVEKEVHLVEVDAGRRRRRRLKRMTKNTSPSKFLWPSRTRLRCWECVSSARETSIGPRTQSA